MIARRSRISPANKGYLFIAPYFLLFAIFSLYPILFTLRISFMNWDGINDPIYIGLKNYQRLLSDRIFLQSIGNTVWISFVAIVFQMLFGLSLAFLLNHRGMRFASGFRTIFYFPNLVTSISLGIIFSLMFDWQGGSVNRLL